MKIYVGKKWREGFLDYYCGEEEYRIKVIALKNLEKLEGVYFIRQKNIKLVINYLKKIGPKAVFTKIISRLRETYRNEKFVSYGVGTIIESQKNGKFSAGQTVAFIAPLHPPVAERITLPEILISEIDQIEIPALSPDFLHYQPISDSSNNKWWSEISGWSIYSGIIIKENSLKKIFEKLKEDFKDTNWKTSVKLQINNNNKVAEQKNISNKSSNKKTAVLFGYGNYAKTTIIPNIKKHAEIISIHEIDPTQIFFEKKCSLDSSPILRSGEKYDIHFIAGFHHTHTPLAVSALNQNTCAVVEKPIVTDKAQLDELIKAIKNSNGKFFAGFHKRYSPFNKLAVKDLNLSKNTPFSYHCVVHEHKQPPLYWYNWPNSKSPLISNGCHWIDHFLYLNNYSVPKAFGVFKAQNGDINASIELENGSFFTMAFSDKGSDYKGVRDYAELRTDVSTVKIIDDALYIAENKAGIIRHKKINKMENYKIMYETIVEKISKNNAGDSLESILISAGATLELEEKLNAF